MQYFCLKALIPCAGAESGEYILPLGREIIPVTRIGVTTAGHPGAAAQDLGIAEERLGIFLIVVGRKPSERIERIRRPFPYIADQLAAPPGIFTRRVIRDIKLTLESMYSALSIEGVQKIEIKQEKFDPTCMEAIASVPCPEGEEPGKIFQIIQDGYKIHDRILRATKVIVYEG